MQARRTLWLAVVVGCAACGGNGSDTGDGGSGPTTVQLKGAVQKGPFVLGSSVAVSAVDAMGNPTGQVFNTQTTDDLGQFQLAVSYQGNVSLEGTGYYYNEASGKLSGSSLTLRAFYSVSQSGAQQAYVNIITHLTYGRVKQLLAGGMGAADAVAQAETELRTALGIGGPAFDPKVSATEMNLLGGDSDANAYVFAVSSILAQIAQDSAGASGSVDATLQELINTVSSSFAQSGTIDGTTVGKIKAVQAAVNPQGFMDLLAVRLAQTGSTAAVPDLNRVWDSDGDGVPNHGDSCPLVANVDQSAVNGICRLTFSSTSRSGTNAAPLVVADFDGDGKSDVVLVGTTAINFYGGDGSGTLGTPIVTTLGPSDMLTPPSQLFGPMPVGVGDLNYDNKLDLIVDSGQNVNNNSDTVFLPGDGAGHFGAPQHLNLNITYGTGIAPGFTHFATGDFNGDGMTDVVGAVGKGDLVYGQFSKAAPLEISQIAGLPTLEVNDVATADLDHDGHADVVIASTADSTAGSTGGLFVLLSTNSSAAPHFTVQPVLTAAGTHPDGDRHRRRRWRRQARSDRGRLDGADDHRAHRRRQRRLRHTDRRQRLLRPSGPGGR